MKNIPLIISIVILCAVGLIIFLIVLSKKTSNPVGNKGKIEKEKDDFLSYTIKLDDWLRGEKLLHTDIYLKHPEVKRRVYKALIEETIKEQGTLELAHGGH